MGTEPIRSGVDASAHYMRGVRKEGRGERKERRNGGTTEGGEGRKDGRTEGRKDGRTE